MDPGFILSPVFTERSPLYLGLQLGPLCHLCIRPSEEDLPSAFQNPRLGECVLGSSAVERKQGLHPRLRSGQPGQADSCSTDRREGPAHQGTAAFLILCAFCIYHRDVIRGEPFLIRGTNLFFFFVIDDRHLLSSRILYIAPNLTQTIISYRSNPISSNGVSLGPSPTHNRHTFPLILR